MPLQIIHQDITKIKCNAIVNPTDAVFSGSGGTDLAVHTAAGAELDEECSKFGTLHQSEIVVTKGYRLPCDYILHTTGPVWTGGTKNEEALLRGCYINALFKASELGVKSIAFPLISSGTFGFPKDKVLRIALTAISNYLTYLDTDMDVFICVFNPEVYEIRHSIELEQFLMSKVERREASFWEMDEFPCACTELEAAPLMKKASAVEKEACAELSCAPSDTLDEWLKQQDDSFAVTLFKLIDKRHMTDVQCYKRANVSKKTFWKINNDPKYKPSKPTVIAFAIALELDLQETEALLKTVGFSLSHSNTFDMIIEFYIQQKVYDICSVLVLTLFLSWEDFMRRNTKVLNLYIELLPEHSLRDFLTASRECEITISNVQMECGSASAENAVCFIANAKNKKKSKKDELLQKIGAIPAVQYLEEL